MDSQIKLSRDDITKIDDFLSDFPEVTSVILTEDSKGCLGSIITASVETKVYNHKGIFSIEISGVQDW